MSVESLRTLQGAQMVPSEPDLMGAWYARLPQDQRFSHSSVPRERQGEYQAWQERHGFAESADYDTAGAFLAGHEPVMVTEDDGTPRPHLGSVGEGGKILKSPAHPTFWKAALVEIVRQQGGADAESAIPWDRIANRGDANRWLQGYLYGESRVRQQTAGGPTLVAAGDASGRPSYPDDAAIAAARRAGFGRELPFQSYLRGEGVRRVDEPTKDWPPEKVLHAMRTATVKKPAGDTAAIQRDMMMRTALAANRSALAGVGFDPQRMTYFDQDYKDVDVLGFYTPTEDQIYVSGDYRALATTPTHESIHRGIDVLAARGRLSDDLKDWVEQRVTGKDLQGFTFATTVHELIVRKEMYETVGATELGGAAPHLYRLANEYFASPENARRLAELKAIATEEIQRQRPRGPR